MFKTAFRIVHWTGKYKHRMYLGFLCSFFIGIFSSLPVLIAAYAMNTMLMDFNGEQVMPDNFPLWMTFALIASILLRFLFVQLRSFAQDALGYEVTADERLKIGNVLKRVPLGYFEENKTGDITSIITTELTLLEVFVTKMVDRIIGGYTMTAAMVLWLLFFNVKIGLITVTAVLVSLVFLNIIFKNGQKVFKRVHQCQEEMVRHVLEYLRGMSQVKSFGNEGEALNAIRKAFASSRDINIQNEVKYMPIKALHQLTFKIAICAIVYVVALLNTSGELSIGFTILFLMFSFTIFAQVDGANEPALLMAVAESNMNNLNRLKEAVFIDKDGKDVDLKSFDIEFNNVSFAYDEEHVIRQLSLKIPEGTTTALVGPSGCGKSTLCHLVARFYDVQEGSITIGGHDLKAFTCDSLLSQISMVFQNVYLFHDTIGNNILFGHPNATKEAMMDAAKKARCHEFIMSLPEGYETIVGESGATLSGGEKQRISIARAILKDAPIIMLDEATASIDPENEQFIQQAIHELTRGKTVITIAHKLATVRNADQIIVMKDGEIHEQGKHEALMNQEGLYKRFIDIRRHAEGWTI